MGKIVSFTRLRRRLAEPKRSVKRPHPTRDEMEIRAEIRWAGIRGRNKPLLPQFERYLCDRCRRAGKDLDDMSTMQVIDCWRVFLTVQSRFNPYVHAQYDVSSPYHEIYLSWERKYHPRLPDDVD